MAWDDEVVKFESLIGKTLSDVRNVNDEEIHFETVDGEHFKMYHSQDCCEHVSVESITGDLADLIGAPILRAEEATSDERPADVPKPDYEESETWTFYKMATSKGYVDIRWFGSSNGYYSEEVEFVKLRPKTKPNTKPA